jgi:hypothetical protein
MKVGLQLPYFNWPGSPANIGAKLTEIGQHADAAGFSSLWVMDHFFQIAVVGKPEEPMLESYSVLNFLAGVTSKPRLGTLVTGVVYRHPGILVKTVTTLDVLSGGHGSASARPGTNGKPKGWESPIRQPKRASSDLRKRCRSRTRCGTTTARLTTARTTSSPNP